MPSLTEILMVFQSQLEVTVPLTQLSLEILRYKAWGYTKNDLGPLEVH